jgi:hypothetical protein
MTKYGNRHVKADGYDFDSKAEHRRYTELLIEVRAGLISDLCHHPRFDLQPAFVDNTGKRHRAIIYEADFSYRDNGVLVVEDVKGVRTKEFILKWKLLLFQYRHEKNIRFVLVNV